MAAPNNPYSALLKTLTVDDKSYKYFDLSALSPKYDRLPYSIRVLLESCVRNCDNFQVLEKDVENVLDWEVNQQVEGGVEIAFKPARVILQDLTGVPAVVDFAAMRDAVKGLGGDPDKINPICPADLVIDHSVQVDFSRTTDALKKNQDLELERNKERFQFLKWGAQAFDNMLIVPPGSGIVHQVNLEYLARVVFQGDLLYPDSVVGTDSHTTMINGLGVVGWGVGGIEAEAVMLGQAISMLLPKVVGYRLVGELSPLATSTDLVLTVTKHLRSLGVVGKFVEFFGPGLPALSIADRATVANMCPEFGATLAYFPVDRRSLEYLVQTSKLHKFVEFFGPGLPALSIADRATVANMCPEFGATLAYFPVDRRSLEYLVQTSKLHKFVEFFGPGLPALSIADRATVANMCPEFGATLAYFPVDRRSLEYLVQTSKLHKFVEFFGPGLPALSIADRATVANMCPEFGATLAYFPVDRRSLEYLVQTSKLHKFVEFFGPGLPALSIADRATVANMCPEFGATLAYFPVDRRSLEYLVQTSKLHKFVEFFGPGLPALSIADRATVANMCPEFGATLAYFPVDRRSLEYLVQTSKLHKFVEFFGPGLPALSIADRATVANMCPEFGATLAYFPVDRRSLEYLVQTNRSAEKIKVVEAYLRASRQFRDYGNPDQDPVFSEVVELDLSTVVTSVSGPKRPQDRVSVSDMQADFRLCLTSKVGFKGYGLSPQQLEASGSFTYSDGREYTITHGSVIIAAITSCTNTSNPSVMLGAGLLAKKAVENGLSALPYIKTSLSPGSGVVTYYLRESGVIPYLDKLGFNIVGYGCMTCIGNSGPIDDNIANTIEKASLVCCGVLSGNRNFEGRIHPNTRANYLASPLLVIAYALAGTVDIDFETQPLGKRADGTAVFLRDIWPTRAEIQAVESKFVIPGMFKDVYAMIEKGSASWQSLEVPRGKLYGWDPASTYIKRPPFFDAMTKSLPPIASISRARCLLLLGDSVTTDHISPAGSIARNSPAARYLASRGLTPREFNSYGSRRGNDAVMVRGTFANIRLVNKMAATSGPRAAHQPSGDVMDIYDAAERYASEGVPLVAIVGKDYGSGSSRDWAAKGPYLLGIKAVIAESFERIHRSNLVGMGIVPLQFLEGDSADTLGLDGTEEYSIQVPPTVAPGDTLTVQVSTGKSFQVKVRFDTEVDLTYFKHGGILNYMIRKML